MKLGFVCGAFDLLHAGHVHLLKECKRKCDYLIVGLHIDPSIERDTKNKPIESIVERVIKLKACRFVSSIVPYEKEADLAIIFKFYNIDVRFLGSDYLQNDKPITDETAVPIEYIDSLPIHTAEIREKL